MKARDLVPFLRALHAANNALDAAIAMGNMSAARNGRTAWNLDDYNAATKMLDALCPITTPEQLMERASYDHRVAVECEQRGIA